MKKFYLALFFAGFISTSLSVAQQIPFQGRLLEAGIPVDGTRDFDFSIDVDGTPWNETHTGVQVSEGLYSLVLGSTVPLPNNLFTGVDSRELNIEVNGSPMSPISVFSPFPLETVEIGHTITTEENRPTLKINQDGSDGSNWSALEVYSSAGVSAGGLFAYTNGSGGNYPIYGYADGNSGSGANNGVFGWAVGIRKYNKGIFGRSQGAGNGDTGTGFGQGSINFGVEGNASGNTWNNTGVEGSNSGAEGVWNFGLHGISNAGTGASVENHGVAGRAYGPGINYGIYGDAGGGAENWAGWFQGDVKITGTLDANLSTSNSFTQSDTPTPDATFSQPVGY